MIGALRVNSVARCILQCSIIIMVPKQRHYSSNQIAGMQFSLSNSVEPEAAFCVVWSGTTLFYNVSLIGRKATLVNDTSVLFAHFDKIRIKPIVALL